MFYGFISFKNLQFSNNTYKYSISSMFYAFKPLEINLLVNSVEKEKRRIFTHKM